MEHLLIALDVVPGSLKSVRYVNRLLKGTGGVKLTLFHVIPPASPDILKRVEVQRLERVQEEQPALSGYFWTEEDEERMKRAFQEAKELLLQGGFGEAQISSHFSVQSTELAQVIVKEAKNLKCSTIVIGRRGLGRVKEFFLGSVSNSVTKLARGLTVWVVDN